MISYLAAAAVGAALFVETSRVPESLATINYQSCVGSYLNVFEKRFVPDGLSDLETLALFRMFSRYCAQGDDSP